MTDTPQHQDAWDHKRAIMEYEAFLQERFRLGGGLRHARFKLVGRVVRIAQDLGALGAQLGNLDQGIAVVVGAALRGPGPVGLVHLAAQFAIVREGHEPLVSAPVQSEHPAFFSTRLGLGPGGTDHAVREAGQVRLIRHVQFESVGFLEQVLCEHGIEFGYPRIDFLHAHLVFLAQRGPAANEVAVRQLDQAHFLLVKAKRFSGFVNRLDPRKYFLIQQDRILFLRQARVDLDFQFLQGVVGIGIGDVSEHVVDADQQRPDQLQRFDGVLEGWRFRVVTDAGDIGALLFDTGFESGPVMLIPNQLEGRYAVGRVPFGEKRVLVFCCRHHGLGPGLFGHGCFIV